MLLLLLLMLMQGKIDVIYIDPPYNTNKDFITTIHFL